MKKKLSIILISIFALSSFMVVRPVFAEDMGTGFLPDCDFRHEDGSISRACTLNDFLVLGMNLIKFMLGISGSLALLFFVYGGFQMLISGGSSEKVNKGKQAITSAAIGLLIVLLSWVIVNFVYTTMIEDENSKYRTDWWQKEEETREIP